MQVDSQKVWEAFERDPASVSYPGPLREAVKPTVLKLPEILSEQLETPVTFESLMGAKVVFIKYCLDNGVIKELVEVIPNDLLGSFSRSGILDSMLENLSASLDTFTDIAKDVPKFLEDNGISEQDVLFSPDFGLGEEVKKEYLEGHLTIGRLIEIQPMVIVKNDN